MPEYEHICQNESCLHEWEDEYSIKQEPPIHCPKCQQATAKRLISGGNGKGIVELAGQDLVNKCLSDAKQIQKEAQQSANKYANLLGESRYHNLQTQMDRRR